MESRDGIISVFKYIKGGEGMVIFPEGTYYLMCMGPGKTGLLRMIQSHLQFPFIPVGIEYKHKGMRTMALIRIGRPIHREPKDIIKNFSNLVMDEIAKLSGFMQ